MAALPPSHLAAATAALLHRYGIEGTLRLSLLDAEDRPIAEAELDSEACERGSDLGIRTAGFHGGATLACTAMATGRRLRLQLEDLEVVVDDLSPHGNPQRLRAHLDALARGLAEHPDRPWRDLPILGDEERALLLGGRGGEPLRPDLVRDERLQDLFEATADAHPDRTALVFGDTRLTYRELEARANRLARLLRSLGAGQGRFVGLWMPRSLEAVVGLLAILKSGAAYLPLDPEFPPERVEDIRADAGATVLLSHTSLSGRLKPGAYALLDFDQPGERLAKEAPTRLTRADTGAGPSDPAYLIYTSGSTGRPKGVPIPHTCACNLVRAEGALFGVKPEDRVFQGFSLAFDASVEEVWLAFHAGAALVVGSSEMVRSGPALPGFLKAAGITVLSTVPTLLAAMGDDVPGLRLLILGGETCPPDIVKRWARPGRRLVNTYGPTEATVIATWADLHPEAPVTIGRPVPNYRVYILDEALGLLPEGVPGELCLAGPGVAPGYLQRPELTAEKFQANPHAEAPFDRLYRTGDLVRFGRDGQIEFLGRIDEQVKLRGFRVELGEIEAALRERPEVAEACVALRKDTGVDQLVAYVVPSPGREVEEAALRSALRLRLPVYMVPALVEPVEALPRLASGKVDRKRLPPPRLRSRAPFAEEATSPTEARLREAWTKLFHLPEIGLDEDFFTELGGHSLLAALLVSDLRRQEAFASLSVPDLYAHPTLRRLAKALDGRQATKGAPAPAPEPVAPWRHTLCGAAQALLLYPLAGHYGLQWLTPYLVFSWMIDHDFERSAAVFGALGILLVLPPLMFVLSILLKWTVLGRVKPGRHRLWSAYYLRWWFVRQVVTATPTEYLAGTPWLPLYLRLMGAKVGPHVHLGGDSLFAFDLVEIGDGASLGTDSRLMGYTLEAGWLRLGAIRLGRDCHVGARSVLGPDTVMEDGAVLGDLSHLPEGGHIPAGQVWVGSPARHLPEGGPYATRPEPDHPGPLRQAWFAGLQALGVLLIPMVYVTAILPGMLLVNELYLSIPGYFRYLLIAPAVAFSFVVFMCLEIVLAKWLLLGRMKPGRIPAVSWRFTRKWFLDQFMEVSLALLGPMYATLYLPPWFRLLGARLGRHAEVSTAGATTPDLLEVGEDTFIADAVSLGVPRVDRGWVTYARTTVGRKAFVGNSATVPAGTTLGDASLLGVLSLPPLAGEGAAADSNWLGNPAIFLPHRQLSTAFGEAATYKPPKRLVLLRYGIEALRILVPLTAFVLLTSLLLTALTELEDRGSLALAVSLFPLLYLGAGLLAAAFTFAVKWIVMGRYHAGEKPLWCTFVWRTEAVTAVHEFLADAWLLRLLIGTPFLPWFFRGLGCRFGKRVCQETTWLTEYDLITVGDEACLNPDATLQTHLFEDRVMKMSTIDIGAHATVGTDAVVLYDSRMEEGAQLGDLSLLMKGEVLPAGTRWLGSPARPA